MESIVVTGASGFVGRAAIVELRELGLPALGVCRRRVHGLHQVESYCDTPLTDVLIHLAEEPDRAKVNRFGASYAQEMADATRRICARAGKVIYASSAAVYGDEGEVPFATDMPVHANDLYCRTKIENEKIVLAAGGVVLRLSNLYGVGMSPNNVLSDIIRQIPGTGPLCVRDDKPIRDFASVVDVARAFTLAAKTPCVGIMNVGCGVGLSIASLARLALQTAGEIDRVVTALNPSQRNSFSVLDISETQKRLGWFCRSSIQDDISHLLGIGAKFAEK